MDLWGEDKARAEKLYDCIRVVGRAFLEDMARRELISDMAGLGPLGVATLRAPDAVLRLAYVIVSAAYRLRPDFRPSAQDRLGDWFKEVLARQALVGHRRMWMGMSKALGPKVRGLPYMPPESSEREAMRNLVGSHFTAAERTILGIVESVKAGRPRPLEPAYQDLVPHFGGPGGTEVLEKRFGPPLSKLFSETRNAVSAF